MALVKCKKCGKEISDKAEFCHSCGTKATMPITRKESLKIGVLAAILIMGVVAMLDKSPPKPQPQAAPVEQSVAPAPPDGSVDPQVDVGCRAYGKFGAKCVSDRESGITFSMKIREINKRFGKNTPTAREMRDVADVIYNQEAGKHLSAQGAEDTLYASCLGRAAGRP